MTDVLMFIEDPGAANFMVPVILALQALGRSTALRVTGAAADYIGGGGGGGGGAALPSEADAEAMLAAVTPRLIFTGASENMHSLGTALTLAARARGLPTVGVVDGPSHAAQRFCGASDYPLAFAPDYILVPDEATAAAFVALGHPKAALTVCGHPLYDEVRARTRRLEAEGKDNVRARALPGVSPDRPVLVFAAEVSTGVVPAQFQRSSGYTLHGSGRHDGRTEIVIEELLGAISALGLAPYTVLRLHPKNTRDDLAPFLGMFDHVSEGSSALDLVFAADALVGMTTILLAEGAIAGRPVLSVLPMLEEREWLPSILTGQIPIATTPEQIRLEIAALLGPKRGAAPAPFVFEPNAAAHAAAVISGLL